MNCKGNTRYDIFTRVLHWLVAIVIIYAMAMGYILHAIEGTRWFNFFSVLNMSLGTIATPVMIVRFVWRFFRKSVPYPAWLGVRKKQIVVFVHELFYLAIFIVLISGFLMLQNDYNLFGLVHITHPVKTVEVNEFFFKLHRISCIVLGAILLIHVTAVIHHVKGGSRDILHRMI